jgi:replicative DNA helicase
MAAEVISIGQGRDEALLPQNIEAEAALLGGLMQANNAIDRIADIVRPEHFFEPLHARIFSAIITQASRGHPANPVTLKPYFDADETMKELGGVAYLAQLTHSGAAVIGINGFAEQVVELAQRRALVGQLNKVLEDALDYDVTNDALAADLEVALAEATKKGPDGATELTAAECATKAREAMNSQDNGVLSGIAPIDEAMGPIRKKNLVILAGRPGMAKTATAISYGNAAARRGHGVLLVEAEMSDTEIGERAVCDLSFGNPSCPLPYEAVTSGTLNEAEMRQYCRAELELRELPFQVIDAGNLSVHSLARMVRRWKRRFAARGQSLDLVIVDYLQKLRVPGLSNRFEVVTEISQTLKEIAKENDLGVMALAQLSRKVEDRDDKRPHMADLRESGQIEQDADVALFLFRQEYYLERTLPPEYDDKYPAALAALDACRNEIEFICAKRRKGRAGTTKGRFYGGFQAVRGAYE